MILQSIGAPRSFWGEDDGPPFRPRAPAQAARGTVAGRLARAPLGNFVAEDEGGELLGAPW